MENIVVRTVGPNGVPIHVKDLGYVADSHETQTSIVRIDDTRGVFLSVNKQPGAHTIAVVDQVRRFSPSPWAVPRGVKGGITLTRPTSFAQPTPTLWTAPLRAPALAFPATLSFLRRLP